MEKTIPSQINGYQSPAVLPPVKYCLYARKSTESDEKQTLSIDSQIKEMLRLAERESLEIIDVRRESHSAKDSGERPVFNEIIADIRRGRFNGILTWAPDRLSRNAGDLGTLVDLMDQKILLEIKTFGQRFTNSPNEKFLLMILGSQAKLENDNKSLNVKRGLRMRCEMGLWPTTAPTGYLNEKRTDRKGYVLLDPERAPVIKKMFEKVANEKWSGRKLYHWLRFDLNFRTKSSHHLSLSNVYLILQNSFYCGVFEYPRGSNNWYTGKYEPLITKELFEKVQEHLKRDHIIRGESKEFAFTRLITCGLCGSGITADEKFKKLSDGTIAHYIYYGCTKSKDLTCKNGYIREEELINQFSQLLDKVSLDGLKMREKIEKEINRYQNFQAEVLRKKEKTEKPKDVDVRNYAKYILKAGSMQEKRELLACFKSRLFLKNKILHLEK